MVSVRRHAVLAQQFEAVRRIAGIRHIQPDISHRCQRPGAWVHRHSRGPRFRRDIEPRCRRCRVLIGEEVCKRLVGVILRRLVVEANSEIHCQPPVHLPVILHIKLRVPVFNIEGRACRGLLVILHVAKVRVRVAVGSVVLQVVRVVLEVIAAGVRHPVRLQFSVVFKINSALQRMVAGDFADVICETPDRIEVLLAARRRVDLRVAHRVCRRAAKLELRQQIQVPVGCRDSGRVLRGEGEQRRRIRQQRPVHCLVVVGGIVRPRIPAFAHREFVNQCGGHRISR